MKPSETIERRPPATRGQRVLVVGVGGLGLPVAEILAADARVQRLTLLDDDVVEGSNLHRQLLYESDDIGQAKVEAAAGAIERSAARTGREPQIVPRKGRLLPGNALALFEEHDLVIEGADNLASKFLAADAALLSGTPCVQAGVIRFNGWAMASLPPHGPCLRCLFEDLPPGGVETCATAGVLGPVVGVVAALQSSIALRLLGGDSPVGEIFAYHGLEGLVRTSRIRRRVDCPLCTGEIRDLDARRYVTSCAA